MIMTQLILVTAVCAALALVGARGDLDASALVLFACDVGQTRVYTFDSRASAGSGTADHPSHAQFSAHVLVTDVASTLALAKDEDGDAQCVRELVVTGFTAIAPDPDPEPEVSGAARSHRSPPRRVPAVDDAPVKAPLGTFASGVWRRGASGASGASGQTSSPLTASAPGTGLGTPPTSLPEFGEEHPFKLPLPTVVFLQNATGGIVEVVERWGAKRSVQIACLLLYRAR